MRYRNQKKCPVCKKNILIKDDMIKLNNLPITEVLSKSLNSLKNTNIKNSVVIIAPVASSITTKKLISIVDKKNPKIILVPTLSF